MDFFSVYLDVVRCSDGQKAASYEAGANVYLRHGSFLRFTRPYSLVTCSVQTLDAELTAELSFKHLSVTVGER